MMSLSTQPAAGGGASAGGSSAVCHTRYITEDFLKKMTKCTRLEDVKSLDIHLPPSEKVRRLEKLDLMPNLTHLAAPNQMIATVDSLASVAPRLVSLSLRGNQFDRLDALPLLPNLETFDMSHNRIEAIPPKLCKISPLLRELSLADNRIKSFSQLQALRQFPNLEALNLEGNEVCHTAHYRSYMVWACPTVGVLDNLEVTQAERDEAASRWQQEEVLQRERSIKDLEKRLSKATLDQSTLETEMGAKEATILLTMQQKEELKLEFARCRKACEEQASLAERRGKEIDHLLTELVLVKDTLGELLLHLEGTELEYMAQSAAETLRTVVVTRHGNADIASSELTHRVLKLEETISKKHAAAFEATPTPRRAPSSSGGLRTTHTQSTSTGDYLPPPEAPTPPPEDVSRAALLASESRVQDLEAELAQLQRQLDDSDAKWQAESTQRQALQHRLASAGDASERVDALRQENARLMEEAGRAAAADRTSAAELEALRQENAHLVEEAGRAAADDASAAEMDALRQENARLLEEAGRAAARAGGDRTSAAEMAALRQENARLLEEMGVMADGNDAALELEAELRHARAANVEAQQRLLEAEGAAGAAEAAYADLQERHRRDRESNTSEVQCLERELRSLRRQLQDLQESLDRERLRTGDLQRELDAAAGGDRQQAELLALERDVRSLQRQLDDALADLETERARCADLRAELEGIRGSGSTGDILALERELRALQRRLDEALADLQRAVARNADLEAELARERERVAALLAELAALRGARGAEWQPDVVCVAQRDIKDLSFEELAQQSMLQEECETLRRQNSQLLEEMAVVSGLSDGAQEQDTTAHTTHARAERGHAAVESALADLQERHAEETHGLKEELATLHSQLASRTVELGQESDVLRAEAEQAHQEVDTLRAELAQVQHSGVRQQAAEAEALLRQEKAAHIETRQRLLVAEEARSAAETVINPHELRGTASPEGEAAVLQARLSEAEQALEDQEARTAALQHTLDSAHSDTTHALERQVRLLKQDLEGTHDALERERTRSARLQRELDIASDSNRFTSERLQHDDILQRDRNDELRAELARAAQKRAVLESELDMKGVEALVAHKQVEAMRHDAEELRRENSRLVEERIMALSEGSEGAAALEARLRQAKDAHADTRRALTDTERARDIAESALADLDHRHEVEKEASSADILRLERELRSLRGQLQDLEGSLDRERLRTGDLQRELDAAAGGDRQQAELLALERDVRSLQRQLDDALADLERERARCADLQKDLQVRAAPHSASPPAKLPADAASPMAPDVAELEADKRRLQADLDEQRRVAAALEREVAILSEGGDGDGLLDVTDTPLDLTDGGGARRTHSSTLISSLSTSLPGKSTSATHRHTVKALQGTIAFLREEVKTLKKKLREQDRRRGASAPRTTSSTPGDERGGKREVSVTRKLEWTAADSDSRGRAAEAEVDRLNDLLSGCEVDIASLKGQLQYKSNLTSKVGELTATVTTLRSDNSDLQSEKAVLQQRVQRLSSEVSSLKTQLELAEQKAHHLSADIVARSREADTERSTLCADMRGLEKKCSVLEEQLAVQGERLRDAVRCSTADASQVEAEKATASALQLKLKSACKRLEEAQKEAGSWRTAHQASTEEVRTAKAGLRTANVTAQEAELRVTSLRGEAKGAAEGMQLAQRQASTLEAELAQSRSKVETLEKRIAFLDTETASLRAALADLQQRTSHESAKAAKQTTSPGGQLPTLFNVVSHPSDTHSAKDRNTLDMDVLASRPAVADLLNAATRGRTTHYHTHYHQNAGDVREVRDTRETHTVHSHSTHSTQRTAPACETRRPPAAERQTVRRSGTVGPAPHHATSRVSSEAMDSDQILVPRRYLETVYQNTAMSLSFCQRKDQGRDLTFQSSTRH